MSLKPSPPATVTNKPSPVSEFKPMNDVAPKEAPGAATELPSSATVDKTTSEKLNTNNTQAQKLKPIAATPVKDVPQNPNDAIPAPGV